MPHHPRSGYQHPQHRGYPQQPYPSDGRAIPNGQAGYPAYDNARGEYPERVESHPHPSPGQDDPQSAERDWAFQNKFGAILAYADMDNPPPSAPEAAIVASNRYPGPGQVLDSVNRVPSQAGPPGPPPSSYARDGRYGYGPPASHPSQSHPNPHSQQYTPSMSHDGYRNDESESEYHPGFDPSSPPFQGRIHSGGGPLGQVPNNAAAGPRPAQMTPPMEKTRNVNGGGSGPAPVFGRHPGMGPPVTPEVVS